MRSVLPLALLVGLVAASPTPLSPSTRATPYDLNISNDRTYSSKHPECGGILDQGCGPLHLGGSGILAGDTQSGILGASNGLNAAGLHVRRALVKRQGLLGGLDTNLVEDKLSGLTSGGGLTNVGGLTSVGGLTNGGGLAGLTQPLGGVGLKRDILGGAKLLNFGRPGKTHPPNTNVCSAGRRYCCKYLRKYSDPRNAGLLDGALVQDGLLNDVSIGLVCELLTGTLAPAQCGTDPVCCTSQRRTDKGIINLGCTLEVAV